MDYTFTGGDNVSYLSELLLVSKVPTNWASLCDVRRLPVNCSKLWFLILSIKNFNNIIIVRSFSHIVVFKGRAKWFINPPIVNKKTKPIAYNIEVV